VQVELTAGAITTMWGGASGNYTVQIVDYKHLKEKQYKCDAPLLPHLPALSRAVSSRNSTPN
jgi:hypothetical protein